QNTNQAGPLAGPAPEAGKSCLLALCLIAFFIMPLAATPKKNAISIYAAFPTADLHVTGTFTATGSLNVSGVAVMDVVPNANGTRSVSALLALPSPFADEFTPCVKDSPVLRARKESKSSDTSPAAGDAS